MRESKRKILINKLSVYVIAFICSITILFAPFTYAFFANNKTSTGTITTGTLDIVLSETSNTTTPTIIGESENITETYDTGDSINFPYSNGTMYLVNKGNIPGYVRVKVAVIVNLVDYGEYIDLNVGSGWTRSATDHYYYFTSTTTKCELPTNTSAVVATSMTIRNDIPDTAITGEAMTITITMEAVQTDNLAFVDEWDPNTIPVEWYKNRAYGEVGFREYLSSSNVQWIDSGILAKGQLSVETLFAPTCKNTHIIFGSTENYTLNNFDCFLWSTSTFRFDYNITQTDQSTPTVTLTEKYKVINNKNTYSIIDALNNVYTNASYPAESTFVGNYNMYLFACNNAGTAEYKAGINMDYCKIWDGDTMVRFFLPAVDVSSNPCMFDVINKIKYYNLGGGADFTISAT